MTRDDIIRLAREAGWKDLREFGSEMHDDIFMGNIKSLERFAALVAAAEREACAKVCDVQIESGALSEIEKYRAGFIADVIRARGENK